LPAIHDVSGIMMQAGQEPPRWSHRVPEPHRPGRLPRRRNLAAEAEERRARGRVGAVHARERARGAGRDLGERAGRAYGSLSRKWRKRPPDFSRRPSSDPTIGRMSRYAIVAIHRPSSAATNAAKRQAAC
jgi:hypothetical protein